MKKVLFLIVMMGGFSLQAQSNDVLIKHYEAFYKQMRMQGDLQGSINALTHLTILQPNQARKGHPCIFIFFRKPIHSCVKCIRH